MNEMDLVRLNFNPQSLWALNFIIGLVMFGVALDLKVSDFKAVLGSPKPVLIGLAGSSSCCRPSPSCWCWRSNLRRALRWA